MMWVGIDVGTQSVKVSVVDGAGRVHAQASAPLTSAREGKRHEQDPAEWIAKCRVAMAAALADLGDSARARISGVATCATSGTITTVDALGSPLSTGLMYDDARAGELSDEVAAADPALWRRLGYRIQPTWALPKILWLARRGDLSGARIATQADVIVSAVIGRAVPSDWSHSLKSGYDLLALTWPTAVLDLLGIDPAALPDVVAPGTLLGASTAEWATSTGLPEGTPFYAGMTDGCAAQLGAGTLGLGDWHTVIGTTLVVKGVSDRIVVDETGAVYSHRAPHDGLWFPGGASSVGAGAISSMLLGADLDSLTAGIATGYSGSLHTIPLSYPLIGIGERFPVVRPDAEGFFPSASAGDEALLASIFLGVACVERLSVETMMAAEVPVTGTFSSSGGGVKNEWWTQLRADLLGRSISIPVSAEGSVGMAILAAWAADSSESLPSVATRMSLVGNVVEPTAANHDQLEDRYQAFKKELISRNWITA